MTIPVQDRNAAIHLFRQMVIATRKRRMGNEAAFQECMAALPAALDALTDDAYEELWKLLKLKPVSYYESGGTEP